MRTKNRSTAMCAICLMIAWSLNSGGCSTASSARSASSSSERIDRGLEEDPPPKDQRAQKSEPEELGEDEAEGTMQITLGEARRAIAAEMARRACEQRLQASAAYNQALKEALAEAQEAETELPGWAIATIAILAAAVPASLGAGIAVGWKAR